MTEHDPSSDNDPYVLYTVTENVATITLNRPSQLNPIGHGPQSMQRAIVDSLRTADTDDDVACVVITGAGRAFSAGGQIVAGESPESGLDWYWFLSEEDADNETIRELRKPVIGAVNGLCYGAAFMMMLHFDIVLASTTSRLGLIETRFGGTGAEGLNYLVGPQWAKFLALSGELISADKAKEIGLVLDVFPPETLLPKALDLARRVAAMPRDTMIMNRRMINTGMNMSGWRAQKDAGIAFNAAVNSRFRDHRAWNGETFAALMNRGWREYKHVRDAPFEPPWLADRDDPSHVIPRSTAPPEQPAATRTLTQLRQEDRQMTEPFPAVLIEETDSGPVTTLGELTLDALPDREILIEVAYSSLNYKDGLALSGNKSRVARRLPMVGGIDLAGTVIESRSPEWAIGDQVIVNGWGMSETEWGGFSRYQRVDPGWLVALPDTFTIEQAMAIGTAGYTAALCVDALESWGLAPDTDGEILVTGAAGGVGSVAIALLAARGYQVAASTGRPETHSYLKRLGAHHVVDRNDLSQVGRPIQKERWSAAVDSVGSSTLVNVLAQLRYGGAVTACGLAAGADLPATVLPHILRGVALLGVDSVMAPLSKRKAAWARLARDLDTELLAEMTRVEPMTRVTELADEILAGRIQGRVVIDVSK